MSTRSLYLPLLVFLIGALTGFLYHPVFLDKFFQWIFFSCLLIGLGFCLKGKRSVFFKNKFILVICFAWGFIHQAPSYEGAVGIPLRGSLYRQGFEIQTDRVLIEKQNYIYQIKASSSYLPKNLWFRCFPATMGISESFCSVLLNTKQVVNQKSILDEARKKAREFLHESYKNLSGPIRNLLLAIIVGERQSIDDNLKQKLLRTGTWHLVSIGGLHFNLMISVVLGFIVWPFHLAYMCWIIKPRYWVYLERSIFVLKLNIIGTYFLLISFSQPCARAIVLYFLTLTLDRFFVLKENNRERFVLAACAYAGFFPYDIFSLSNVLSWTCYFIFLNSKNNLKSYFTTQILLLCMSALIIGQMPFISLFSNFIVIPLFQVFLVMGCLHLLPFFQGVFWFSRLCTDFYLIFEESLNFFDRFTW